MMRTATASIPAWGSLLLAFLLLLGGCRKPDAELGLDLLPSDELATTVETTPVEAFTFQDAPLRTSGLTRNLLGSYLDGEFGTVRTGLVSQVRMLTNNVGQGQDNTGLVADSIVLAIAYELPNYAYGNLNPQHFRVYEITESLSLDSTYESDHFPELTGGDLVFPHAGTKTPDPLIGPTIDGVVLEPQLRLRLTDELAERFLGRFGTDDLTSNTTFLEFFKGLYVSVENGSQAPFQAGILYMNTLSAASKMTVYYKDQNNEPDQQRTFDLDMNSNCVRYTVAEHDHSAGLDPGLSQALADPDAPASFNYVQTLGGLRTAVSFPDLASVDLQGRALAKAELVVAVPGTFYPYYTPPSTLFAFRKASDGEDVFLPDQLGGINGIGGVWDGVAQEYRFNITRYVLGVMNGALPDEGIELVAGSSGVSANRVILGGPANPEHPMRLELTFTTY
ncbi:MAG: DUF4270 family protein [Flavobacteriales bacterium]|nr:DUF4270 family protein [Flavobacteriales bacterium]